MALEGLLANLLALPSTLEDQQQQNAMLRSVLGPQTDVNGATTPGVFTPEQLQAFAPDVDQFPGMNVPVLGTILKGVGETGQLLQTALGSAPDAPRIPLGTFVQVQQLQEKQNRRRSMMNLLSSVPPAQQPVFKQLVDAGDFDNALKVGGFAKDVSKPSQWQLLEEQADLSLKAKEGTITPIEQRRLSQIDLIMQRATGMSGDRAQAGLGVSIQRGAAMAGIQDQYAQGREERSATRRRQEREEERQRRMEGVDQFLKQNPLGGKPAPTVPVRPMGGYKPISLLEGEGLDAVPQDPLAGTETSRTLSPENASVTMSNPLERQKATLAMQQLGIEPETPEGYSEAQYQRYDNAVKGSGAEATALGGLTPDVRGARALERTELGRAEVLSLDEALAWGVPAGTTVGELREMQDRGEVTAPVSGGNDAESQKELRRIRAARSALSELVSATDQLTTSPALAISRLQGIGLEWSRLGGNLKSAQIAAASMIAPTLRKAFGDTGNMGLQEQLMTMDAVIPNSGDTEESARNKLLVMDNLLSLMESSVTGQTPGPGVKEQIIQMVEGVDPSIRERLGVGKSGVDIGDGFTVELVD